MTNIKLHLLIWYLILHSIIKVYAWAYILIVLGILVSFGEHILTRHTLWPFCGLWLNKDQYRITFLIWYCLLHTIHKEYDYAFIIFVLGMLVPFVEHILTSHSLLPFCCISLNNYHYRIPMVNMIFDTSYDNKRVCLGLYSIYSWRVEHILTRHHSLTILLPMTI